MSDDSHLDKIKKLLRLSKSANPHEAELAMARAMELAAKHAVDVSALGNLMVSVLVRRRFFPARNRLAAPQSWRALVSSISIQTPEIKQEITKETEA